eukprot:1159674-Pelagomonas_calceolata.AAC.3
MRHCRKMAGHGSESATNKRVTATSTATNECVTAPSSATSEHVTATSTAASEHVTASSSATNEHVTAASSAISSAGPLQQEGGWREGPVLRKFIEGPCLIMGTSIVCHMLECAVEQAVTMRTSIHKAKQFVQLYNKNQC